MEAFWFIVVTLMLAIYVVLDGFDFGTGIVYLFVAKTEPERRMARAAIGPVWIANEVWLITAGGLLFFAFPRAYAAGFSGFYLALIIVLWLFIFRGLALELREHVDHAVWRQFWDFAFSVASLLLAIGFGAALGNLIRGVPLNADGYFFAALWTDFSPGLQPGILDWYTVLMAVTSVAILVMHGANYLAMKTEGALAERAGWIGEWGGWVVVGLTVAAAVATPFVQPGLRRNYDAHPIGYVLPVMGILSLAGVLYCRRARRDEPVAFLASSMVILGWLGSAAWGLFPHLLIATTHPTHSLTIYNAAATPYGLQVGLLWFLPGFGLALAYTIIAHRAFWGKVNPRDFEAGH